MKPLLSFLLFCLLQPNVAAAESAAAESAAAESAAAESAAAESAAAEKEDTYPRYKPSTGSPQALDIRSNAYGPSRDAPNALGIGVTVPDFEIPKVGGGIVSLKTLRKKGPVTIVFYRGHW